MINYYKKNYISEDFNPDKHPNKLTNQIVKKFPQIIFFTKSQFFILKIFTQCCITKNYINKTYL